MLPTITTNLVHIVMHRSIKIYYTVQAMAVRTATSMCPLYRRSLHPPPAFFSKLIHAASPEGTGRRKSARKLINPQFGLYSSSCTTTPSDKYINNLLLTCA
ncbi:hypothetical protein Hanom_Chr11g00967691 [Helianthus anomalus]